MHTATAMRRFCPKCNTYHPIGVRCPKLGFGRQLPNRGRLTEAEKAQVRRRCRGRCMMCGVNGRKTKLQYDHIVPVWDNGPTTVANMQLLCVPCHQTKTANDRKRQLSQ